MKFSITDLLSEYDQIRRLRRLWSHLLIESVMENPIFCAVKSLRSDLHVFSQDNTA